MELAWKYSMCALTFEINRNIEHKWGLTSLWISVARIKLVTEGSQVWIPTWLRCILVKSLVCIFRIFRIKSHFSQRMKKTATYYPEYYLVFFKVKTFIYPFEAWVKQSSGLWSKCDCHSRWLGITVADKWVFSANTLRLADESVDPDSVSALRVVDEDACCYLWICHSSSLFGVSLQPPCSSQ